MVFLDKNQNFAEEIEKILEDMNKKYEELLNLCKKENEQIIYEDLKGLIETIMTKEKILNHLDEKKNFLKNIFSEIKKYYCYGDNEYVPFNRILNFMPEEKSKYIMRLKNNMEENLAKIKNISVINKKYVTETVSFINYVIDFLKNGDGVTEIYDRAAQKDKKSTELNFLDVSL